MRDRLFLDHPVNTLRKFQFNADLRRFTYVHEWFRKFSMLQSFKYFYHTVTYRPIARQGLGKHIPAEYARNTKTSITRQQISKQAFWKIERLCFLCVPCRGVIMGQRRSFEGVVENWVEFWRLQPKVIENGKKGIRLCKEDFMCDLKLQWDCDESVARIRLVKTENPNNGDL
jgi:hypothetical protein